MLRRAPLVLPLLLFALIVLASSWISDDAYITLRTIEHLLDGHGLRWNVDERVQAFTHPLWALLVAIVGAVSRHWLVTLSLLSTAVSTAAVAVVLLQRETTWRRSLWIVGCCALSKSFVSYSTSGLENPLTHLLLALFWRLAHEPRPRLWALSLLTGLALCTRMDLLLIFGPLLAAAAWQQRFFPQRLSRALLGLSPFVAWELFSLVYYGSLVPNTAYAKLSMGVPSGLLLQQGLLYYAFLFRWDAITLVVIALGVASGFRRRGLLRLALTLGILLYGLYLLRIGGDFMGGRFFTAPLFGALLLLEDLDLRAHPASWLLPLPLVGLLSAAGDPWHWLRGAKHEINGHGVADERIFYFSTTGLFSPDRPSDPLKSYLPGFGHNVKKNYVIKMEACIGMVGFYAGPGVRVIDVYGLAEPLLARLPTRDPLHWRIGHFWRNSPPGYYATDSKTRYAPKIVDPDLAIYYDKLRLITEGPVFTLERFLTIATMLTGGYEDRLRAYVARQQGKR